MLWYQDCTLVKFKQLFTTLSYFVFHVNSATYAFSRRLVFNTRVISPSCPGIPGQWAKRMEMEWTLGEKKEEERTKIKDWGFRDSVFWFVWVWPINHSSSSTLSWTWNMTSDHCPGEIRCNGRHQTWLRILRSPQNLIFNVYVIIWYSTQISDVGLNII